MAVYTAALFAVSFVLRIVLIFYGLWQDQNMVVKYTDIDYQVFSDAGKFVLKNESPYKRQTYRYTPLLAMMMQLNFILTESFGKIIFCLCDILTAYISYLILKYNLHHKSETAILMNLSIWLFNPLSLTVSSRGNAESIISVFVLLFLYVLTYETNRKLLQSCMGGLIYGFSIHLKIYPITYALILYLHINYKSVKDSMNGHLKSTKKGVLYQTKEYFKLLFPTVYALVFGISAMLMLMSLTIIFYIMYGDEFINESYLYHITRKDIRHNFSPYFYIMYLTSSLGDDYANSLISLMAFVPQIILMFLIAFKYYKDVIFACFIQTCIFVAYNKVFTSQYFLWFLALLPVSMVNINITKWKAVQLFTLWITGQAVWLLFAYLLEFHGINTFLYIWLSGLLFFLINNYIIYQFIIHYNPSLNKNILKDEQKNN